MKQFIVHLWSPYRAANINVLAATESEAESKAKEIAKADHGDHEWHRITVNSAEQEKFRRGFEK